MSLLSPLFNALPLLLLFVLLVAAGAPVLYRMQPTLARYLLPLAPLGLTVYFASFIPTLGAGAALHASLVWVPQVGLSLTWHLDGLSLLFALLISGVGCLVTLYAGAYLTGHHLLGRLYGYLFLFMASMLGVVLTDNVIALFVFWELTSLSSYFLIGFDHHRASARHAALQALLVTGTGGLALLAGVILLAQATGTHELSAMATSAPHGLAGHHLYVPIVLLVLVAAATKSAQFPFHFWLPRAMEAPTPVSAYLHAATMVKAGLYLLARLSPLLSGAPIWHQPLVWMGATTAVLGGGLALGQSHLKRLLAYSTVGALGIMVLLLGIGTSAALHAMVVFLMAHALYKGSLFLVAGVISHATHESDIERLGGLRAALPATAAAGVLAALSMGGVPPLAGYLSKELLYAASLTSGVVLTGCAVLASALFLAAALGVGVRPFWARAGGVATGAHSVSWPLWFPPLLLALAGALLGLWPRAADGLLRAATLAMVPGATLPPLALWHGLGWPLGLSALTLLAGLGLYLARRTLRAAARPLAWVARLGPDRGYGVALSALISVAGAQTRFLQRGYLRGYLIIILTTTLVVVAYTILRSDVAPVQPSLGSLRFYEAVIAGVVLAATLSAIRARSRFASILSLGAAGYGVALIFILFGAPDLGITQLVIETLTVLLLILAFYHLPKSLEPASLPVRVRDGMVAVTFGALMTTLVLVASHTRVSPSVSNYYRAQSVPAAHGRNVVNVILTDFRALDTLGEITVVAMAALGVFALLKLKPSGGPSR